MATFDFHRRQWLLRLALTPLLVGASLAGAAPTSPSVDARKRFLAKVRALEHEAGGRIGVSARRVAGGPELAYRGGERFLMCSTFKLALAASVSGWDCTRVHDPGHDSPVEAGAAWISRLPDAEPPPLWTFA